MSKACARCANTEVEFRTLKTGKVDSWCIPCRREYDREYKRRTYDGSRNVRRAMKLRDVRRDIASVTWGTPEAAALVEKARKFCWFPDVDEFVSLHLEGTPVPCAQKLCPEPTNGDRGRGEMVDALGSNPCIH